MDPPLPSDPAPPLSEQTTTAADPDNSTPHAPPPNHPPYTEMIAAAVAGLNEPNGSSKQAIAKYIESQYTDLPATHAALLTHHLKTMKLSGQLVMDKHSYKLPNRSATVSPLAAPPTGVAVNAENLSDPAPKRRRGRPPKPKVVNDLEVQLAVPVFVQPASAADVAAPQNVVPIAPDGAPVAAGPESVGTVNGQKRGRGRPPKIGGVALGPSSPLKSVGAGRGRPRGRPPKTVNIGGAPSVAAMPVVGKKRRGRPPKIGSGGGVGNSRVLKKPRRLSGKPLGRPKKSPQATPAGGTPDSQLLVAYLDLKTKFENLQARIRQTATLIKPCLNNEAALSTLNELEMAGMMNPYVPQPTAPQAQPMAQPQMMAPPQS